VLLVGEAELKGILVGVVGRILNREEKATVMDGGSDNRLTSYRPADRGETRATGGGEVLEAKKGASGRPGVRRGGYKAYSQKRPLPDFESPLAREIGGLLGAAAGGKHGAEK
jgi:hypothetical protein